MPVKIYIGREIAYEIYFGLLFFYVADSFNFFYISTIAFATLFASSKRKMRTKGLKSISFMARLISFNAITLVAAPIVAEFVFVYFFVRTKYLEHSKTSRCYLFPWISFQRLATFFQLFSDIATVWLINVWQSKWLHRWYRSTVQFRFLHLLIFLVPLRFSFNV